MLFCSLFAHFCVLNELNACEINELTCLNIFVFREKAYLAVILHKHFKIYIVKKKPINWKTISKSTMVL